MKKLLLNSLLFSIAILLGIYLMYIIYTPYQQGQQFELRAAATKMKLKDIRAAQRVYKIIHKEYANNFDSLTYCILHDSVEIQKTIGDPNDSSIVVTYEMIYESALSQVDFVSNDVNIQDLQSIPLVEGEKFDIGTSSLEKNGVVIPTFQVTALKEAYLKGLPKGFISSKKDLYIGDLLNPSDAGNWQ